MLERLQQIPPRILEWWKKFSTKQRVLIVSSIAVVIAAMVILGVVLSKPKMVVLKECDNTTESAQVKQILDDNGITSELSDDSLTFYVKEGDRQRAELLLAENSITPYNYEWENLNNVFSGGFSATEADKTKRYKLWMENDLEEKIKLLAAVDTAQVTLNIPDNDGTLIRRNEPSYAWVTLGLNSDLDEGTAAGLARAIATALGNEATDTITIIDTNGRTLFTGGEDHSSSATANDNLDVKAKAESRLAAQVRDLMMETGSYSSVSVAPNLDLEFTDSEMTQHEIYTAEGEDAPLPSSQRTFDSSAVGGLAAAPGTDANDDDTTYVTEDGSISESTVSETETNFQNSERIIKSNTSVGRPNYENSSLALVTANYRPYNEDDLRARGQLDGMSFAEFQETVEDRVRLEVDPDLVTMVSNATGIPEENISIVSYEIALFNESPDSGRHFTDFLPVILAALIMLMLGFVIFRSTRKEVPVEAEPELSVEALLASTREAQEEDLEDIGFSEKSETRILIEKFVDENPEAVASLLRNWLTAEWE